eukprot:TRINITY_DN114404_c0_g1_i1.p1 TRINITY_DN114404_c0_g1~~TRINITY_DN114404_c0_g1_i1.p1  ORF type:complete len:513 (+),score=54.03 TRINITY_DN114404_c0_g1_i1:217-1539(+)
MAAGTQESPDAFKEKQLKARKVFFVSVIFFVAGSIVCLGIVIAYKKADVVKLWHLQYHNQRGLLWRGKGLCSEPQAEEEVRMTAATYRLGEAQLAAPKIEDAEFAGLLRAQEELYAAHPILICCRRVLLYVIFSLYIGISLGVPIVKAGTATCNHGFYWEDHMYFLTLFAITKAAELAMYVQDPTISGQLDFLKFMILFCGSILGFSDGYTDATAIAIARACDTDIAHILASTMLKTYAIGVVFLQWIVIGVLTFFEPTQACLMKLVHMDALANCITIHPDRRWMWTLINILRTFGEDIPQAIQQALFLFYVRKNYFMMLSVLVSIGSSLKALRDACKYVGAAAGGDVDQARATRLRTLLSSDASVPGMLDEEEAFMSFENPDVASILMAWGIEQDRLLDEWKLADVEGRGVVEIDLFVDRLYRVQLHGQNPAAAESPAE